jgi:glutathione S-transferase
MKLYNSFGPNPWVVRFFLEEKGIEIPMVEIDILKGENREAPYKRVNPTAQCPALELDNGQVINEITVICDYLEELYPEPVLVGATPEERAITRMWCRRLDMNITEPMANGFRFAEGLGFFENRIHCIPQAADDLKTTAHQGLRWLDELMGNQDYLCGSRLMLPDIYLYCFIAFFQDKGQPLDTSLPWVNRWFEQMQQRPAATASSYQQ